jgi:hypothetical protein
MTRYVITGNQHRALELVYEGFGSKTPKTENNKWGYPGGKMFKITVTRFNMRSPHAPTK